MIRFRAPVIIIKQLVPPAGIFLPGHIDNLWQMIFLRAPEENIICFGTIITDDAESGFFPGQSILARCVQAPVFMTP